MLTLLLPKHSNFSRMTFVYVNKCLCNDVSSNMLVLFLLVCVCVCVCVCMCERERERERESARARGCVSVGQLASVGSV
jgi:hypothetical protein